MADDITYTDTNPAGVPDATKQVTDEHATRGHMPVVKLAVSADGSASLATVDADGVLVNLGANNDVVVSDGGGSLTVDGTVSVTEPVSVDDNGGSLTVDGTVTANAGTGPWPVTDNGGSLTVDGTVGVSGTVTVDTELPAAAALADNTANPTAPAVGAFVLGWDGATWDRMPGTSADGQLVNLGANNDVTVTGTVTANLAAGTNNIGDVDVLSVPAPLSTSGGGTEAAALRVTVANDSTGVLSVDDNGSSLTVDAPVGTPVNVQVGDGSNTATVRNLAANDALNVAIVDGSGAHVTSFGGGTQYAEDTAHVSGDQVTMAGVVQQAADAALSSDGDRSVLQVDSSGYLKVNIKAGAGSGGTAMTDDAAFTVASSSVTPIGALADETTPDSVDEGDVGAVRMSTNRNLYTQIRDSSAERSASVTASNALKVDGSAVTQPVSGTVTANAGTGPWPVTDNGGSLTVDGTVSVSGSVDTELPAAAALADNTANPTAPAVGAFLLGYDGTNWDRVRADGGSVFIQDGGNSITVDGTVTANAGTGPWPVTDNGGSLTVDGTVSVSGTVTVDSELPAAAALADNTANPTVPAVGGFNMVWDGSTWDRAAGNSTDGALVNLGANNDVTVTGTVTANQGTAGTAWEVVGDVAQDAAIAGNPLPTGLRASDAEPSAMSADGDAVYGWGDRSGRFVTTQKAGTATLSNVNDSATSVTVLASNTARVGATIFNDSTSTLYLKLGSTASTTSFTAKLYQDGYYEVPFGYTGVIDGIWSADSSGAARVTEIT